MWEKTCWRSGSSVYSVEPLMSMKGLHGSLRCMVNLQSACTEAPSDQHLCMSQDAMLSLQASTAVIHTEQLPYSLKRRQWRQSVGALKLQGLSP